MTQYSAILIFLWLLYGVIHSVLASLPVKNKLQIAFPAFSRSYRLIYNILAVILLLPLLYIMLIIPSSVVWQWSGVFQIIANILAALALMGFAWSLKFYDNMDFLGLSQFKQPSTQKAHKFTLSPLHRHVRHPWYFFALILIWTRDMNEHFLISSVCMTIYFIIGSIYEDRKLVVEFGRVYEDYQRAVPGLIPSFRRFLTKKQAEDLQK